MNLFKINCSKRELLNYRKSENCVKIEKNNSFEHEFIKFLICFILKNNGISFVTEARFKLGGRADIFDLENQVIYEILHSEDESKFDEKIKKYPGFHLVKIYTKHYNIGNYKDIIPQLRDVLVL